MRYVAAYLLATLGGNANPSDKDLKKILSSVGIDANADNLKKVISELKGKNLEELMEAGKEKLASVPSAGAVAAAPAAAGGAPAGEEKKEEKKKEESEAESDDDMGFGLFD